MDVPRASGHPTTTAPVVLVTDERPEPAATGDDADEPPVDLDRWSRLAHDVLVRERIGPMQVSIEFVDAATIAELKREHLDGDGAPTDVLAFPIDEPVPDDRPPTPE